MREGALLTRFTTVKVHVHCVPHVIFRISGSCLVECFCLFKSTHYTFLVTRKHSPLLPIVILLFLGSFDNRRQRKVRTGALCTAEQVSIQSENTPSVTLTRTKYRLYHEKEGNTGFKSPQKPIV